MHKVQCNCGAIRANLDPAGVSNRAICYCTDCRAFALFLERPDILDRSGGTELIQVAQSRLQFTLGIERLVAIRLTERGMIRWYSSCCKTPIGNTMPNPKMIFVGLIHSCLNHSQLNRDFGESVALVSTSTAVGDPKPKQVGLVRSMCRFLQMLVVGRMSGAYRKSPFFAQSGSPVVEPRTLTPEQLARLKSAA